MSAKAQSLSKISTRKRVWAELRSAELTGAHSRSITEQIIPKGSIVTVEEVQGAKLRSIAENQLIYRRIVVLDNILGIIILAVVAFLLIVIIRGLKIVPQAHVFVIEHFGSFKCEWQTGMHTSSCRSLTVSQERSRVKEKVVDFKPQPVITKDNVTMQIDTVVFYQVTDAKQYIYGVERPLGAIENLSATTLRNIIGEMELDATLTSRDVINTKITSILDQATDRWGIKVNRVELKNILPPREIQDAMEKQMKAERERREKILQAEGDKKSQVSS